MPDKPNFYPWEKPRESKQVITEAVDTKNIKAVVLT